MSARGSARAWKAALLATLGAGLLAACASWLGRGEPPAVADWKRQTTELRGLAFTHPVRFEQVSAEQVRGIVRDELESTLTPGFVRAYRDAYAALGVLPPEIDLVATLLSLYESELAGLYSPRHRTMYLRGDFTQDVSEGKTGTVVHELVHALQHQHFPRTLEVMQTLKSNDDAVMALGAAVEGDASLTMLGVSSGGPFGRDVASATVLRDSMLDSLAAPVGVMARVPRLLRESLVFPYAYGAVLAARSYEADGNRGLDALVQDGPVSTLQVRFPEESEPVDFIRLPLDAIASHVTDRGCRVGENNVAGLLTVRVLFQEQGSAPGSGAAPPGLEAGLEDVLRGWSGDRFVHLDCKDTWELIWLTRWDTPATAEAFARRYRTIADAVASSSKLSGAPRVLVSGRSALVLTPGVLDLATQIQSQSEVRSYASSGPWLDDGCFPEASCPTF